MFDTCHRCEGTYCLTSFTVVRVLRVSQVSNQCLTLFTSVTRVPSDWHLSQVSRYLVTGSFNRSKGTLCLTTFTG